MVWTAFILGLAGSFHCLGMCSPLAMAVTNLSPALSLNRVLYNVGRILTYGVLGSLVASFGLILPMFKYQALLSILLGIALVLVGSVGISSLKIPFISTALVKTNIALKSLFGKVLKNKNPGSVFLLGTLNGFLPCGLSFLAFTYCLTLAGPLDGFNFMMLFGLGTLPVMLGFTTAFKWLSSKFQFSPQKLTTGLLIISGVLLIARVFVVHLPHAASFQEGIVDIVLCR